AAASNRSMKISASMALLHGCSGALSAAQWFWFTSWVARRSVDAIASEQPHPGGVAPRHPSETVLLDLVQPVPGPLGGRGPRDGRQGWIKPPGVRRVRNNMQT